LLLKKEKGKGTIYQTAKYNPSPLCPPSRVIFSPPLQFLTEKLESGGSPYKVLRLDKKGGKGAETNHTTISGRAPQIQAGAHKKPYKNLYMISV